MTPGRSEKQCIDTQRESGDLFLVSIAKTQGTFQRELGRTLALHFHITSNKTDEARGARHARSTLETTHLKDSQLNQLSVSTKSCNIHLHGHLYIFIWYTYIYTPCPSILTFLIIPPFHFTIHLYRFYSAVSIFLAWFMPFLILPAWIVRSDLKKALLCLDIGNINPLHVLWKMGVATMKGWSQYPSNLTYVAFQLRTIEKWWKMHASAISISSLLWNMDAKAILLIEHTVLEFINSMR